MIWDFYCAIPKFFRDMMWIAVASFIVFTEWFK